VSFYIVFFYPDRIGELSMQIIGGKYKGKRFLPLRENAVRPTAARVREAVFNILSSQIEGAVILDLFAGTGAMGLEALSRGAVFAVFIDINRKMISQMDKSISQLDISRQTKLIRWDISKNLNCIKTPLFNPGQTDCGIDTVPDLIQYNLVFIDPPYSKGLIAKTLYHLRISRALIPGAIIVIEHDLSESVPTELSAYRKTDQRKYGRTFLSFMAYIGD
jgi:16S rRNA (guanine966-N2)-methyltransferase